MNRQQFNKYLAGTTLPGPQTLERICALFDVEPETMFHHPKGFRGKKPESSIKVEDFFAGFPQLPLKGAVATLAATRKTSLREGCYFVVYPWLRAQKKCIRSALLVRKQDDYTFFSRHTKFRLQGRKQSYYNKGCHEGIAIETDVALFLLGSNKTGLGEISLLSFTHANALSRDLLSGVALVTDAAGETIALRAILQYVGPPNMIRRAITNSGIMAMADCGLPIEVQDALTYANELATPVLRPMKPVDTIPD